MRAGTTARLAILLALLIPAAKLPAEIYKWVDEQGQVHYSDRKPDDQSVSEVPEDTRSYQGISYGTLEVDTGEVEARTNTPGATVVMLSASWCGTCKKDKQYFRRNGIPFREYDIENSSRGKRLYEQLGATGVPVILVGKQRMNGFSEAGFERLIR
jgi:glutaredoxin